MVNGGVIAGAAELHVMFSLSTTSLVWFSTAVFNVSYDCISTVFKIMLGFVDFEC